MAFRFLCCGRSQERTRLRSVGRKGKLPVFTLKHASFAPANGFRSRKNELYWDKYPHAAFPYDDLVAANGRRRGHNRPEYEIADTGIFDQGGYFDVMVEYANAAPDDILMRVTVTNLGPEMTDLHVLPQRWARNTWFWDIGAPRPSLRVDASGAVSAVREGALPMRFGALQEREFLFCENDTNPHRMSGMGSVGHFKDGIAEWVSWTGLCALLLQPKQT